MTDNATSSTRIESRATLWAALALAVTAIIVIVATGGVRLPLSGNGSLGNLAAVLAGGSAGLAFAVAFAIEWRRGQPAWRAGLPRVKRVVDLLAMTAGMTMLSYLVVLAVAALFQLGFRGLTIDPLGGGALAGAASAALTYAAVLVGARLTARDIASLATLVLFIGTMASMLSSPDESWWQLHFSQLGNADGISGYRFNLALIVTGAIVTVLANYVGHDIERGLRVRGVDPRRRVRLLSWLFAGIGICLMIAGFIPDAVSVPLHVGAASGMVVIFGAFVACVLRLLPDLPRAVTGFSLLVVVGILVAALLWVPIGYYNLTGMEFIAAGLLFAWLVVFVRSIGAYAEGERPAAGASAE